MRFGLILILVVMSQGLFAKSMRRPNSDSQPTTFKYSYDKKTRNLRFEDLKGRAIGDYNDKEFPLNLFKPDDGYATVAKHGETEIFVTQWLNGAATYNVRVFVPNSLSKDILSQSTPYCDFGAEGDPVKIAGDPNVVKSIIRNGKRVIQVMVQDRYEDCISLRSPKH